MPIGPSDLHRHIETPDALKQEHQQSQNSGDASDEVRLNSVRNKLLLSQQMLGNQSLLKNLIGQA